VSRHTSSRHAHTTAATHQDTQLSTHVQGLLISCLQPPATCCGKGEGKSRRTLQPHGSLTCTHISFCTLYPNLPLLAAFQSASTVCRSAAGIVGTSVGHSNTRTTVVAAGRHGSRVSVQEDAASQRGRVGTCSAQRQRCAGQEQCSDTAPAPDWQRAGQDATKQCKQTDRHMPTWTPHTHTHSTPTHL
jgi:hypothetical protein